MNKTPNFRNEIIKDNNSLKNVHTNLQHLSVPELRNICDNDRRRFAIACLNVTGDLNTGMIIRSASLFGALEVLVFGRNSIDKRSTVGAENYINIYTCGGLREDLSIDNDTFYDIIESRNYFPIFLEQTKNSEALDMFNWKNVLKYNNKKIPCLVFGNEGRGISNDILYDVRNKGYTVSIPQRGVLRSFNVSAAANIVMWDMISKTCRDL